MRNLYKYSIVVSVILNLFYLQIPCSGDFSPNWVWDDYPYSDYGWVIAQTPDGSTQIVGSKLPNGEGGCTTVFDWRSPWPIYKQIYETDSVEAIAISDDGQKIATMIPGMIYAATRTGEPLWEYSTSSYGYPQYLDFDPLGDLLVVTFRNPAKVLLINSNTGDRIWDYSTDPFMVRKMQISNDGRWIFGKYFSSGIPGISKVIMFDLQSPTPDEPLYITEIRDAAYYTHTDMALDGQNFVVNSSEWVEYHDFSEPVGGIKTPLWEINGGGYPALGNKSSISNDGSVVAYHGSGLNSTDGHARVFLADGTQLFDMVTEYKDPEVDVSADGSRIAFSGDNIDFPIEDGRIHVWDRSINDILCEFKTFGPVELDQTGDTLFVGSGRDDFLVWTQPSLLRIEDNDPPICSIESPETGSAATGSVTVTGLASDTDDDITNIEVLSPTGVILANPVGSDLTSWEADVDLSDVEPGMITLKARSIDSRYKHGQWSEVTVSVMATPTPMPTPSPTPTPFYTENLYLGLQLPAEIFVPGDVFYLDAQVLNNEQPYMQARLFVLLEVHGVFFAAPSWSMIGGSGTIDFLSRDFPFGVTHAEIIPDFIWPETFSSDYGLIFYGLITSAAMDESLSNLDMVVWGYQ